MSQRGILYERLESLDRSRRGHLSTITKVCNALDERILETLLRYEHNKYNLIPHGSSIVHAVINMMICLTLPVKNIRVF